MQQRRNHGGLFVRRLPIVGFCILGVVSLGTGAVASASSQIDSQAALKPGIVADASATSLEYVLGPGDQLNLFVPDLDDFKDKTFRIDGRGELTLPLMSRIHAGGLTVTRLQEEIRYSLLKFLKRPEVIVSITEYRSQPVSVLGAVGSPGVHQLQGAKTLVEVLSLAGGLRPDAGSRINITRNLRLGPIPLPNAKTDVSGQYSVASVAVRSVLDATDPSTNIVIAPQDVISVSKGDVVYAVGSVNRPGGFPLGQDTSLSALQVVSLAQGLQKTAAGDKARILRSQSLSTQRIEIPVNLKKLMAGKGSDIHLEANDILFIPNSDAKSATYRSLDAIVTVATGLAVYGRF